MKGERQEKLEESLFDSQLSHTPTYISRYTTSEIYTNNIFFRRFCYLYGLLIIEELYCIIYCFGFNIFTIDVSHIYLYYILSLLTHLLTLFILSPSLPSSVISWLPGLCQAGKPGTVEVESFSALWGRRHCLPSRSCLVRDIDVGGKREESQKYGSNKYPA